MSPIGEGFREAVRLLWTGDAEVYRAAGLSLRVSSLAVLFAVLLGIPAGVWIGIARFRGRRALMVLLETGLTVPTVLIGLLLYSLLSRMGPFGSMGLLYTPSAMVLGQTVLILPIVTVLSAHQADGADPRIQKTAWTLGAGAWRTRFLLAREIRFGLLAAAVTAAGRALSEVGVSMILGGNIRFYTRNLTAAIALETGKGNFGLAIALGLVLLTFALAVNILVSLLRRKGLPWTRFSKSTT